MGLYDWACVHEGGGRWVGSSKVVELKKKKGKERCTRLQAYSDVTWEAERNTRESSNSERPFFTPTADLGVSSMAPGTDSTAFTPLR